jgi:hypothetical protein
METVRRAGFWTLAGFILLTPAVWQVFGHHSIWLRPWVMYSGVGVGILDGTFVLRTPDGAPREMTPLEALGLERYPPIHHYAFDRRVGEDGRLDAFAGQLCETLPPGARLSFEGYVGTREGWRALSVEDVCIEVGLARGGDRLAGGANAD